MSVRAGTALPPVARFARRASPLRVSPLRVSPLRVSPAARAVLAPRASLGARTVLAGVAVGVAGPVLARRFGDHPRWRRQNHRGRAVSLTTGPLLAAAVTAAAAGRDRLGLAAVAAGCVAGCAGGWDDLVGGAHARGFRGHLAALQRGELTTGQLKLAVIGAGGLVSGRLVSGGPPPYGTPRRRAAGTVTAGMLVAGTANLVNLLDLRPGRALKAVLVVAAPVTVRDPLARRVAAPVLAAALAALPSDLAERTMIGDTGANAVGALLGLALAVAAGGRLRLPALAVVLALTAVSEVVSFSAVIERNRALRGLDHWGRAAGAAA